jgi:hypothetical protein
VGDFSGKPRLSDARLATDQEEMASRVERRVQGIVE